MKKCLVFFVTISVFFSCQQKNAVSENEVFKKGLKSTPTIQIQDAQSIMVSADDESSYVVTKSNVVRKIVFSDADTIVAPEFASLSINRVIPIDSKYVYMSGEFWYIDDTGKKHTYKNILVRKSDGAIFDFGEESIWSPNRLGDEIIRRDWNSNIYFGSVKKLNFSDPENLLIENYLPEGENCSYYEVDRYGNCLYKYGEGKGVTHSNGTENYRLRKKDGGIAEISVNGRDNHEAWTGNNGLIYLVTYTWQNGYDPIIHKVENNSGNVSIVDVWTPSTKDEKDAVGNFFRTGGQGSFIIRKNNSVIFVDTYFSGIKSFEFFEETNTVELIELPEIEEYSKIVYNDEFYYIASGNNLYRVSLENHGYENLFGQNEYSVYSMEALENGILEISALRFSDGKKVLMHVLRDKSIQIIDETSNYQAKSLVRIF